MLLTDWLRSLKRRARSSQPTRNSQRRRQRPCDQAHPIAAELLEDKTLLSVVSIIDDGDPGFSATGFTTTTGSGGHEGDFAATAGDSTADTARWTFDVVPGFNYQVSATWVSGGDRATDAPFTIFDGTTPLVTVDLNQQVSPDDFIDGGTAFENLATVSVTGNQLVVELADDANGFVVADAIRIEPVFDTLTVNGGPGTDDNVNLLLTGPDSGTITFPGTTINYSSIGQLNINLEDGDDHLTIDLNGFPLPAFGLGFNGGTGGETNGDSLTVMDGTAPTFTNITHTFDSENDGNINVDGRVITYTGLEPVNDNLNAVNRIFTFTGGAETITLSDDAVPSDGVSLIDSTLGESVAFLNPTGSLTINAGTGDDVIDLLAVDDLTAIPALVVNGDDDADTINGGAIAAGVFTTVTLNGNAGNDIINGTGGVDTISGGADNDTITGNAGADILNGDSEDDQFVWNNGDGSDTIEGGTGTDMVTVNGAGGGVASEDFTIEDNGAGRVVLRRNNLTTFTLDIDDVETLDLNTDSSSDDNELVTVNPLGGTDLATLNINVGSDSNNRIVLHGTAGPDVVTIAPNETILGLGPVINTAPTLGSFGDQITINGNGGNDSITVTAPVNVNLVLNGGADNDTIDASLNTAGVIINGDDGMDMLIGSQGVDTINGGADNDTIVGGPGADIQNGDAGDDLFIWNNGDGPDDNTGGADTDTFTFNGADGPDDILSLLPGPGDGSLAGAEFNLERFAPSAFTIEGAGIENVNINGLAGDDDITVVPSTTLNVTVNGGSEAVGDILRVDAAGADVVMTSTEVMVAGSNPITYSDVEQLDIQNAGQAEIHGDAAGNLFEVAGNGGTDMVTTTLDGQLINVEAAGLTFRGMAGDDVLVFIEGAMGLPEFSGTATDSHTNAAFGASGLGPANVGLHFDGGGDSDSLVGTFMTAQDVAYFSDDVAAANSGVVNISGRFTLSFDGLAPIGLVGAGGSLTVDATSTPATTTLIVTDAGLPGDGVNAIAGDGGFETTTFSGFASVTVRGGDGSETITLSSLDDADPDGGGPGAALTSITLDGDNTGGTDMADDLILVEALPSAVTATVTGGGGNDIINIGSPASSLDPILGAVTIAGEDHNAMPETMGSVSAKGNVVMFTGSSGDVLIVDDAGDGDAATWDIDDGSIMRTGAGTVTYGTIETLFINTGSGADDINVLDTTDSIITDIGDFGGSDDIDVTTTGDTSFLVINAGTGDDIINIASTGAGSVTIADGESGMEVITLASSGAGSGVGLFGGINGDTIIVDGTGGGGAVVEVQGGDDPDTININATAAGSFTDAFGGAGDDTINVDGSDPNTLDGILGAVCVFGGAGMDVLTVNDEDDTNDNTYTINANDVTRQEQGGGSPDVMINYDEIETLNLLAGVGRDKIIFNQSDAPAVFINGNLPTGVAGDPTGDLLVLATPLIVKPQRNATSGIFMTAGGIPAPPGPSTGTFIDIENVVWQDRYEINDIFDPANDIDQSYALGSEREITESDLSIHSDTDIDFFRYTAHSTGKAIINSLFNHEIGDLQMNVRDSAGNIIASANTATDNEQIIIPVVAQEVYYIEILAVPNADPAICNANNYSLEIENFAAPIPNVIDLNPVDDSGMMDDDDITSDALGQITIEADLTDFQAMGITILTAAQATGGTTAGAAVELFVNGTSVGFADPVAGTNWDLYSYTFTAGELAEGDNLIKAAVVIFDAQMGPVANVRGRTTLSEPLNLDLDTTNPVGSLPDLLASSDSGGSSTDDITNERAPAFSGTGEANAKVFLFANGLPVGNGVVRTDGTWEITSEPLVDGAYAVTVQYEDLAGNTFTPNGALQIIVDPYEPNNTISQATVLGSETIITLNDVLLHSTNDQDFFKITAHDTGKLIINAFFSDAGGDVDIFVVDMGGNFIAGSASVDDNEQVIIPVVGQEMYFLQVVLADDPDVGTDPGNIYDLEIENFPAPKPTQPDLLVGSDTGMMDDDNVTADTTPTFEVQADLTDFEAMGILIDQGAGTPGADVLLSATSQTTGTVVGTVDASQVSAGNFNLWTGTFGILPDDEYVIEAWVRIEDGQNTPVVGRGMLGEPLTVVIDATAPTTPAVAPNLLDSSDAGMLNDDEVTNKMTPTFNGTGEPNAKVRVLADGVIVGEGVVNTTGNWKIEVAALTDGAHNVTFELEDAAGNISAASPPLAMWVDTAVPNTPYLDLINDDGHDPFDNITGQNILDFLLVGDDTVNGNGNPFPNDVKYRLYWRLGDGNGEVLVYDSYSDLGGFTDLGQLAVTVTQTLNDPMGTPFPDGVHNFKLEVEDRAGNISPDFLLQVQIDTTPPIAHPIDLLESSDSGMFNDDNVTNKMSPAFQGVTEANAIVRLFAQRVDTGTVQLVGSTVAGGDLSDVGIGGVNGVGGQPDDGLGLWEITSEPLTDGLYDMFIEVEDWAGNVDTSDPLRIEIDTVAPNQAFLDLVDASDSGRHNEDNLTNDDTPTVSMTSHDPDHGTRGFQDNFKFRIFDRFAQQQQEFLLYDSTQDSAVFNVSVPDMYTSLLQITETLPEQYIGLNPGGNLPAVEADGTLADGVHNLKLEVEDRAGNISQDYILSITIDTVAPAAPTLMIDPSTSDTGVPGQPATITDNITSDADTGFVGEAEANSIVRLWADGDAISDMVIDGSDVLQGLTVADPQNGNDAFPLGEWRSELRFDLNDPDVGFPLDGVRQMSANATDLAGNTGPNAFLDIFIDTQGPQVESIIFPADPTYPVFDPKPSVDGPTPRTNMIQVTFRDDPTRVAPFQYEAVNGGLATNVGNYLLVGDANGVIPIVDAEIVDGGIILGDEPDVVFVIDISGSTSDAFGGTPVGDLNGDGTADTILDAEIAGFIALNEQLKTLGFGDTADVSIVAFSSSATTFDMDVVAAGIQISTSPNADADMNGVSDVEDLLRTLFDGGGTDYEAPLGDASAVLTALGTTFENGNVIFLSDGEPNSLDQHIDESATINAQATNVRAFGVGPGSSLPQLQIIDPTAQQFSNTDELLAALGGGGGGGGMGAGMGTTTVKLTFGIDLPDDRYTFTIDDSITDDAGNHLDGETNASGPLDLPFFPSGDKVPGMDFIGRFTVDSRPEIAVFGQGDIKTDANGNFVFDPTNTDYSNRDLTFDMGIDTDFIFTGQFVAEGRTGAAANDGFDRFGAYGLLDGSYRWLLDFNNDGVNDYSAVSNLQMNGLPISGNFDPTHPGDEIGLFNGTTWWLDTSTFGAGSANNNLDTGDTTFTGNMRGLPFTGDFDGDGLVDLATHFASSNRFFFDLTTAADGTPGVLDGNADDSFVFGFSGVLERPAAADYNQDGFDDVILTNPNQDGNSSVNSMEWYFLISDATQATAGTVDAILQPANAVAAGSADSRVFSPAPLGNDLFARFGNNISVPLVGNFDPPPTEAEKNLAAGDVDGDADFDANDTFLIQLSMLSGSDSQMTSTKGSSRLSNQQVSTQIRRLQSTADIDGDGDFDANDSFLMHLVNLAGTDFQIEQSKGRSPLSAVQIRANVRRLESGNATTAVPASSSEVLRSVVAEPASAASPVATVSSFVDDSQKPDLFHSDDAQTSSPVVLIETSPVDADSVLSNFREWIDSI